MTRHPYGAMPDHAFWRRSVAARPPHEVDPVIAAPFTIAREDRVATAGSCFAQHIARYLANAGFNFLVTEDGHPLAGPQLAATYGYGVFTARYGNIYTARQLLQLFRRAYGEFEPVEDVWRDANGRCIDPFRPRIQPGGFACLEEFEADRAQHLRAVRRAFEELDLFVFTLGLTECWESRADGAVFPLCPGVAGGEFDDARHGFINLEVEDVVSDLLAFRDRLRAVNAAARMILTVSPVPLAATAEDRHVLVSTTYSKSVLRVACDRVTRDCADVAYFPSYEIITGSHSRGLYFAEDRRSVTEQGVAQVMELFLRHFTDGPAPASVSPADSDAVGGLDPVREMEALVELDCDEELLDRR